MVIKKNLIGLVGGLLVSNALGVWCQEGNRFSYGFEIKAHYRDSAQTRRPIPAFFPPAFLPPGETRAHLETVEPGGHGEISRVTLFLDAQFTPLFAGRLKIDTIDYHERNPTSTDNEADVDEFWLRYGREVEPGVMPEHGGIYLKVGKFGKMERQDDRNLESYGMISTLYNRLEDVGLELGRGHLENLFPAVPL